MEEQNFSQKKERVIVYIDGFNLYFGMKEASFTRSKWLNLTSLAQRIIKENQQLIEIKYFTSRVSNDPDKQKRQSIYLEALESVNVKIIYGKYQTTTLECHRCGYNWVNFNEKMTDVNIASHILIDAYQDKYDCAILISGDSDLVPPIRFIHDMFKNKRVFVAFPPKRSNNSVSLVARGSMTLGRKLLADCQFESNVLKKDGYILKKPTEWE